MADRYENRDVFLNNAEKYLEYNAKKGTQNSAKGNIAIMHFSSPQINYPTDEQMRELRYISHIWKQGDSLYKLADEYYNDPTLWWVITWFNKKPLPSDYKLGDVVEILLDYTDVYFYMD
jgi:nucleoid-associated protein YgaU|tara:strand:- start:122 stop:478 length:357 start_codon:yes stop_codon:yes gene_type:complete